MGPCVPSHAYKPPSVDRQGKSRPGLVSCLVPRPGRPEFEEGGKTTGCLGVTEAVWINIWCSQNNEGKDVGISYCDLVWQERRQGEALVEGAEAPRSINEVQTPTLEPDA